MNEKNEIKSLNSEYSSQKLIYNQKGRNIKNKSVSNSTIHLNFVSDYIKNSANNSNQLKKINSIQESKSIADNNIEKDYDDNLILKKNLEDVNEKEKQLILIYDKFLKYYEDKKFETILKEVAGIKDIYHAITDTSFKIFMIKIRCLLKALKQQYIKLIRSSEPINLAELLKKVTKIMKDFEKTAEYISPNHTKNYEEITRMYAKFLLYLSIFSKQKDEYIKSMTYSILGVNLMKVYFVRRKFAENIKTYIIFSQLLLLLINYLIGDNNIPSAIYYCQIQFKLLKVAYKIISQNNLPKKYYLKLIEYSGYTCLYFGVCLEQIIDYRIDDYVFLAYRQARYFLNIVEKSKPKIKSFILLINKSNKENIALLLSKYLVEKYQKLAERERKKIKLLKNINKDKEEKKEKIIDIVKLENMRQKKYEIIEKNIYKNILTPNNQTQIERLDNELISVLYPKKINKKTPQISYENKKLLCNFKLQNILMSNNFRKYIVENEKIQFNNPLMERQSIQGLQRYLNKNIKIGDTSDVSLNYNKNLNKLPLNNDSPDNKLNLEKNKNIKAEKIILKKHILKKYKIKKRSLSCKNIFSLNKNSKNLDKEKIINPFLSYNQAYNEKKIILNRNHYNKSPSLSKKTLSELDLSKTTKEEKNLGFNYFKLLKNNKKSNSSGVNNIKSIKNVNIKDIIRSKMINRAKFRYSNSYSFLENDFERKFLDKSILTSKYSKNISYLDSFTVKELDFQKSMLKLKENNSKMFIDSYEQDLNQNYNYKNDIKENAYNTFLFLKDKANDQTKNNKIEDFNDKKTQPNILVDSKHILKVFNKYVESSREKVAKRLKIYSQSFQNVKRNNEVKLLNLNKGLKELNYMISYKNKLIKDSSFDNSVKLNN